MNKILRNDAEKIARGAIAAVSPAAAVRQALEGHAFSGRLYLVSVGKAAWKMAETAVSCLDQPIQEGIVITKYCHVEHPLDGVTCYEAGHPVPDSNTFAATQAVLEMTKNLTADDTVLFLLSGGGSALFEDPLIPSEELQDITAQLLASGADIVEMNTVRKRLSAVKGGRFAIHCAPAKIYAVVLSDILGDPLDMIASGPAAADPSTCAQARAVIEKYGICLSREADVLLNQETPKALTNVTTQIIGSVRQLCSAAARICQDLGYEPIILTDRMDSEAREMGRFVGNILATHAPSGKKLAFLAGGETVVHIKGTGLGGRNQELALAAADPIEGLGNVCLISVGSDGTDGPTDAAGGYVDGRTKGKLGAEYHTLLDNNDAYHALQKTEGLVITGPTGTNVNDVTIGLIDSTYLSL